MQRPQKNAAAFSKKYLLFPRYGVFLCQPVPKPDHARYAANVMLRWKGVYAEEDAFQHRILQISHDPELAEIRKCMGKLRAS